MTRIEIRCAKELAWTLVRPDRGWWLKWCLEGANGEAVFYQTDTPPVVN